MQSNLTVKVGVDTIGLIKGLQTATNKLDAFGSATKKLGGMLAGVFSVGIVANFIKEVSKLSGEAEAVRNAFERLPNSIALMDDLKRATGGTVSELDLMKRAVQASNFDISLSALPRLLEFATLRAQQTGQSVDYLVDSIVTGIGRKSKLILDNLGISAVQLNEALGGTSTAAASIGDVADAVGKIAESNLKNMEGFSENAATKLQRLSASWENVKTAIGDAANSTGVLGTAIDVLVGSMDVLASRDLTFMQKLSAFSSSGMGMGQAKIDEFIARQKRINDEQKKQGQIIQEVDRYFKEFAGDIDAYGKTIETHIYRTELLAEFTKRLVKEDEKHIQTLEGLKAEQSELNSIFDQTDINNTKELASIGAKITAINKQIEAIERLKKAQASGSSVMATAGTTKSVAGVGDISGSGLIDLATLDENVNKALMSVGRLQQGMQNFKTKVQEDIGPAIGNAIGSGLSSIADAFGRAAVGVGNFGDAILQALIGFARQMGEILISTGIAALAAKKLIANPATAIAAGAALIAIAGAASAGLSKSQQNFNGGGSNSSSYSSQSQATSSQLSQRDFKERIELGGTIEIAGDKLLLWLRNAESKSGSRRG